MEPKIVDILHLSEYTRRTGQELRRNLKILKFSYFHDLVAQIFLFQADFFPLLTKLSEGWPRHGIWIESLNYFQIVCQYFQNVIFSLTEKKTAKESLRIINSKESIWWPQPFLEHAWSSSKWSQDKRKLKRGKREMFTFVFPNLQFSQAGSVMQI